MSEPKNPADDSTDREVDDPFGACVNHDIVIIYEWDEPSHWIQSDSAVALAEAR
ncbi:hypothetical protein ACH9L7_18915 (plasmid) [Haloferax sp. S1W]|uniref:hypothetical protein n=1 Tax=Haloferax sp. S1W TaxID=3377110 RepID=UPI0037C742AD